MMTKASLSQQHLLTMRSLNAADIELIINTASQLLLLSKKNQLPVSLRGKIIVHLFFEPSTRTLYSFDIAAKQLQAISLPPDINSLSTLKGESLTDTLLTFEAMGARLFIIRHPKSHQPEQLAQKLSNNSHVINAGDGQHQHPSQALIDLMTIQQYKPDLSTQNIAIIGDSKHSRVAHSLIEGLKIMGNQSIRLIAPPALLPEKIDRTVVKTSGSLADGLEDADVIITLRIQKERFSSLQQIDDQCFSDQFSLTQARLKQAKPDAIVLHPGPINRGIEIDTAVADGPQSVILNQVSNGIAVRMALMLLLLNK